MQLEFLLTEAFRNDSYTLLKFEGDVLVFKLSKPLKVNHLGAKHSTDIVCYNVKMKRFSGGMIENGDVKIPDRYAFVFTVPGIDNKDTPEQGVVKLKQYFNSKGMYSVKDIKDGKNTYVPQIDIKDDPEMAAREREDRLWSMENGKTELLQFRKYKKLPSIEKQKEMILKYADKSTSDQMFILTFPTRYDRIKNTKWLSDESGYYPLATSLVKSIPYANGRREPNEYKKVVDVIMSTMVHKKRIEDIFVIWSAPTGNFVATFLWNIKTDTIEEQIVEGSQPTSGNGVQYVSQISKFDLDDKGDYTPKQKEAGTEIVFNDINKLQLDSPEEVEQYKAAQAKKKADDDAQHAALKKSLATSSLKKSDRNLSLDSPEDVKRYNDIRAKKKEEQSNQDAALKKSLETSSLKSPEKKKKRHLEMD